MSAVKTNIPIMAHLVLGYPTLEESIRTAEQYIAAGCAILELQIPFSHPTADGPVITRACQVAVEQQQVTVDQCLDVIAALRMQYPDQEIIVMSYVNRVYAYGPNAFVRSLRKIGVEHLIIPDLPLDAVDVLGLDQGNTLGLVPVLAANTRPDRLDLFLKQETDFFYLMSDFKITGSQFSLHPRLRLLLDAIRSRRPQARIGIGFGIKTPEQVEEVLAVADVAIIGSALIEAQQEGCMPSYLEELQLASLPMAQARS
jgi:tryptophan synthase alpha chain